MLKLVQELINKFKTHNIYELCDCLDIDIMPVYLGDETYGMSQVNKRIRMIHINTLTPNELIEFVIAHELGHILMHPDFNTPFLKIGTIGVVNKIEREANEFATALLLQKLNLDDYDCLTVQQTNAICSIPKEMTYYSEKFLKLSISK